MKSTTKQNITTHPHTERRRESFERKVRILNLSCKIYNQILQGNVVATHRKHRKVFFIFERKVLTFDRLFTRALVGLEEEAVMACAPIRARRV